MRRSADAATSLNSLEEELDWSESFCHSSMRDLAWGDLGQILGYV